jgi:transcriptional regulator with XRE-family HTH domain
MNQLNDRSVSFAQFLRQRRMALRLRQAQIAAELHVEPETVGHWEGGRRRMELNRVPRLAAILRLNQKDLCRLALFEWHPLLYATLFGADRPQPPRCLEASRRDAGSGRDLLPPGAVGGRLLEAGVIVCHGLGQAEELA